MFAALAGRKRLMIVEGARHNESLRDGASWVEIDRWIDDVVVAREVVVAGSIRSGTRELLVGNSTVVQGASAQ